jgi:[ribosomal protein S5]-alanine N-acetyltransferase
MEFEILTTPRLLLRKMTPDVYDFVFQHYPEDEIKRFFGCRTEDELEEEKKKYTQGLSMYRKSSLIFQLIDPLTMDVLGWCGYHTWYVLHNRAEIGYILSDESRRRQGLMKEALQAVIRYGFEEMGLTRIEAMTAPDNDASNGLLTSMGFVLEGRLREHYLVNGVMEDSLMHSLLQREYAQKAKPAIVVAG